jgi:hypothetical protein
VRVLAASRASFWACRAREKEKQHDDQVLQSHQFNYDDIRE